MSELKPGINQLFLRDEELRLGMELLYYAYRDFNAEADRLLTKRGFAIIHHRVLYFVARQPQISISELLQILHVTKQSLGRALRQLSDQGFLVQAIGRRDRRQRLLTLTRSGEDLERELSATQRGLLARAYRDAGAAAVEGFRTVLYGLIQGADRKKFGEPVQSGSKQ
jgi:DNA-binding MarR family transcriptional regulator